MSTISVAELRQNPSPAFDAVEHGQTLTITRYRRPIAQLTPADRQPVHGTDVMHALLATPVDDQWVAELEAERLLDHVDDAWTQQ